MDSIGAIVLITAETRSFEFQYEQLLNNHKFIKVKYLYVKKLDANSHIHALQYALSYRFPWCLIISSVLNSDPVKVRRSISEFIKSSTQQSEKDVLIFDHAITKVNQTHKKKKFQKIQYIKSYPSVYLVNCKYYNVMLHILNSNNSNTNSNSNSNSNSNIGNTQMKVLQHLEEDDWYCVRYSSK